MEKKSREYVADDVQVDDISFLDPAGTYSYSDYLKWSFEERVELIKGKLFRMSPAPNVSHQTIIGNIHGFIWSFLRKKSCRVFIAPFDVRFPEKKGLPAKETFTVVQPDICVVCNPKVLDHAGCNGAPDLIVEILSPSTSKKDLTNKYELYEEFKVREYWIAYPGEKVLEIFYLEDDKYSKSRKYVPGDRVESNVLSDLELTSDEVFDDL